MTFKFKYIFYSIIVIMTIVLLEVFMRGGNDNVINEYTVYNNSSINRFVNYKLKEEVKKAGKSTEGLETTTETTGSKGDGNYSVADGKKVGEVWGLIKKYSDEYSVDPLFVATICSLESEFGTYSATYADDGYVGLMQLGTQPLAQLKEWGTWDSKTMTSDRMNDDNNIRVATVYLKGGYDHYIIKSKWKDDVGAWAAGYNDWWDTTTKKNPPFKDPSSNRDPNENKRYYYMAKLIYDSYKSGEKKIGESKDWARKKVGY